MQPPYCELDRTCDREQQQLAALVGVLAATVVVAVIEVVVVATTVVVGAIEVVEVVPWLWLL